MGFSVFIGFRGGDVWSGLYHILLSFIFGIKYQERITDLSEWFKRIHDALFLQKSGFPQRIPNLHEVELYIFDLVRYARDVGRMTSPHDGHQVTFHVHPIPVGKNHHRFHDLCNVHITIIDGARHIQHHRMELLEVGVKGIHLVLSCFALDQFCLN
jgi:hypothetical protein